MTRPLYSWAIGTGLCLTIFGQGEPVMAHASRPIDEMRLIGMPTTILIDKEGRELGRLAGPAEWDSDDAKTLIQAAMK